MNNRIIISEQIKSSRHPFEDLAWASLTDTQKAQLLLGSLRMLDTEAFTNQFGSWEAPEIHSLTIKNNSNENHIAIA